MTIVSIKIIVVLYLDDALSPLPLTGSLKQQQLDQICHVLCKEKVWTVRKILIFVVGRYKRRKVEKIVDFCLCALSSYKLKLGQSVFISHFLPGFYKKFEELRSYLTDRIGIVLSSSTRVSL